MGLTRVNEAAPRSQNTRFVNSEIDKYDSVIKDLSGRHSLIYIPMSNIFLEHQELLVDSVHPNAEGHKLMFERVREHLEKAGII